MEAARPKTRLRVRFTTARPREAGGRLKTYLWVEALVVGIRRGRGRA
jgi:hypothetical protein